jgi:glycosyltransferase involved in cell wall biosynthesis
MMRLFNIFWAMHMRVINIMFGKGLGGIEQAFVDYTRALNAQNNEVIAVIHPDAQILPALKHVAPAHIAMIKNSGQWDIFARKNLRALIKKHKPDAIICHGNRAISMARGAAKNLCPVIGVAHNYNIARLAKTDAAFSITQDLKHKVEQFGQKHCFQIPNMIEAEHTEPTHIGEQTIGSLGRFVKKKGFDVLIEAVAIARTTHPELKLMLAGDGEEKSTIEQLIKSHGLEKNIDLVGWVEDKKTFYSSFNIFCLPSHHEPFGIVLLEAFAHAKPIITTASEGPSEITTHGENALVTPTGDAQAMADAICTLLNDQTQATNLAKQGHNHVKQHYSIEHVGNQIQHALKEIVGHYGK